MSQLRPLLALTAIFFNSATASPPIYPELASSAEPMLPLEQGWSQPPTIAKTRVWWWWLNSNTDKPTITRELEAMKAVGVGGANIIDAGGDNQHDNKRLPHGPDFGTPEWRQLFTHAVVEADRLGLELGFNIQSGWNLGGPSVTPAESSKRASYSLTTADGGTAIDLQLAKPETRQDYYQDVAVLAWPLPATAAEISNWEQKSYFKYPGRFTAAATWHLLDTGVDDTAPVTCQPGEIIDLSGKMDATGHLRWDAPAGKWEIMRFGYTSSGAHVSTHSENAGGLAIDYLDRATLDSYWTKTLDPIFADVRPYLGKSLRYLHTDSWELGPVNWTRLMPQEFKRLRGYDLTPMLPIIAGRVIGSHDASTRFLNDFRRTLADLMASNKYEGFSEKAHALGMGIHPESGGPHAGPMDALRNLGISDMPMGEFWSRSPHHRVKPEQRFFVKQTTSAAHTYGRRISLAEGFTNIGRHWQHDPRSLKPTFDRAACEGHNLTMWHTMPSSKAEHGMPGAAYFAGEHFGPNITWWPQAHAFISYLNRCHFMLQQGLSANDVLHFYGENIPAFVRLKSDDPAKCLPGYDYDVIDKRALLERTSVDANGHVTLPDGIRYRMLSIPPHDAISLPVLQHIAGLVEKGATLVGKRPNQPFSLAGGDSAEQQFHTLCDRLWGKGESGTHKVGKGRVICGKSTRELLQADGVPADFTWTGGDTDTFIDFIHRRTTDTDIFFVANRNDRPENVELRFRVTGLQPEFWDPVTSQQRMATDFREENGTTIVPFPFTPEQSMFVLFRKPASKPNGKPNITPLKPVATIDGPWQVAFDPKWGGPAAVTFDTLSDWTNHADDAIRYYSGAATYTKTFTAPTVDGPVTLDLGMVESLCEVSLNGTKLGVLWSAPFRVDLTQHLKPGANQLEVKVVNLWCNRIIGDASLPEDKLLTHTNITNLKPESQLSPSGLLGPVQLLAP